MKIIKLNAENVKKLRAVEITPDGNIVTIAGKNGAGKTSVLDSLWWALAGTSHIQAQPIRKGETKARIRLDLGEIIVERKFTPAGSSLSVENADGARFPSPQKMLDALLGALTFDPLAFSRMEPRKQFDELRRVSELDVDIEKLDGLNRGDYERRTEINRDAKAKRAQAEGIVVPAAGAETVEDASALVDELQKAGEVNADIEARKGRRAAAQADIDAKKASARAKADRAEQLRAEVKELEDEASRLLAEAGDIGAKLAAAPPLPDPIDVSGLRARIDAAQAAAAAQRERDQALKRRADLAADAEALESQAKELTEKMAARDKEKADAIARAKLPVPGLSFGDGEVAYNGIPLEQASTAEQLRVSLAIAMAANPKLKVIRIQDGSLLDDDSMAAIAAMAAEHDYQVWIERVDTSGKVGIVIDDGMVVGAAQAEEAAA